MTAPEFVEPTEEACRAAFDAFFARPEHLAHIVVAPPEPIWWAEMRDGLRRALAVDRKRVLEGKL
jgi:hypothetical protein